LATSNSTPIYTSLTDATLESEVQSRLTQVEQHEALAGFRFYNAVLTDRTDRTAYFAAALDSFADVDLIFFDPDNGLAPSEKPKGPSKFVFAAEIERAYARGHSVLIYQHFPRVPRNQFILNVRERLERKAPGAEFWCFRTAFAGFFLIAYPRHSQQLANAAESIPIGWKKAFVDAARVEVGVTA
jgi:hypothetical protein